MKLNVSILSGIAFTAVLNVNPAAGQGPQYNSPGFAYQPGAVRTGPQYNSPGFSYQPGAVRTGPYGQTVPYYLRNQPGVGFYYGHPYAPYYPVFGLPQPYAQGGYISAGPGGVQVRLWKAPSGFYYPWGYRWVYPTAPTILYVEQGATKPATPPLSTVIQDLSKFLDESKPRMSDGDYNHCALRLKDIINKERSARFNAGGTLDEEAESEIRKDLDSLAEEIAYRIKR